MDEDLKKAVKSVGYFSTIGLAMALSIGIGAFIGYYIDKTYGTAPWFSIIFLGFGIVAAFRNLYIMYQKTKDL